MKRNLIAMLAALLALGAVSCDVFDDDDNPVANVYASGSTSTALAAGGGGGLSYDILELTVSLADVTIYPDATSEGVSINSSGPLEVDLVAAASTPGLLGSIEIPAGEYQCVTGNFSFVNMKVDDGGGDGSGSVCSDLAGVDPDEFAVDSGRICLPAAVSVDDNGSIDLVVDLPLNQGNCNGDLASFSFGSASLSLLN